MKFVRPLLLAASVTLLAACQVAPSSKGTDYSNLPPFALRASAVLVDDATIPSNEPGRIESVLTPSIAERFHAAAEGHYAANAKGVLGAPQILFTVSEGTITETALPVPESQFQRAFRNYADTRYDGRIVVTADISSSGQFSQTGYITAQAHRSIELGNIEPAGRVKYLNAMTDEMVHDAIAELDKQLLANLSGLVNPTLVGDKTVNGESVTITPQLSGRWDKMKNWQ